MLLSRISLRRRVFVFYQLPSTSPFRSTSLTRFNALPLSRLYSDEMANAGNTKMGEIELLSKERKICDLLLKASKAIDRADPNRKEDLELRITGGWVRDRVSPF